MTRALVLGTLLIVGTALSAIGAAHAGGAAGRPAQPPAPVIEVDKIADTLYVLRGGGGNTAAFITSAGVVLVDTKLPGWGKPILQRLQAITAKPVTTIINTHTHFDHVGSNAEFPAAVEVIAHENTAALMREMRPVTAGPQQPPLFKESGGRGLPGRTFADRLTVGSGRERVELYYFGRAHTGGDAWVVFPAERVLHTGDVFGTKTVPIVDANNGGSGVAYPETIAKAAAALTGIDTVITGHHDTTLTMEDLKTYGEFARDFVEAVQAAKNAGRSIDDFVETWAMPERLVKEGYHTPEQYQRLARQPMVVRVRANAEIIWRETK